MVKKDGTKKNYMMDYSFFLKEKKKGHSSWRRRER